MQSDSHTFSKPVARVHFSDPNSSTRESYIFALQEGAQVVKWRQGESSKGKDGRMTLKFGEVNEGWMFTNMLLLFLEASDLDHHSFTASHSMEFLYKTRICFKYAYASEQRRAERVEKPEGEESVPPTSSHHFFAISLQKSSYQSACEYLVLILQVQVYIRSVAPIKMVV